MKEERRTRGEVGHEHRPADAHDSRVETDDGEGSTSPAAAVDPDAAGGGRRNGDS